jgi:hypothetical protein
MARTFNVFSIAVVVLFVSWAYNVDPVLHTEVEIAAHPSEVRGVVSFTGPQSSPNKQLMMIRSSTGPRGMNGTVV